MQEAFNELERAKCIIVACIDGPCIGAGIELALACDIVFCTKEATFCIKETEFGFAADLGLLQRGPLKCTKNPSLFTELAVTAVKFAAEKAFEIGLVGRIFANESEMLDYALFLNVASKSKECLSEVKQNILYSRINGTEAGLAFARQRNSALLLGNPLVNSAKL
jgi:enoyl-CoA hydratase/carnithine racemase